jgi:TusA-related sulfurtransferase
MKFGDVFEVESDCPTFETDVKTWCERVGKTLPWINEESGKLCCQIQF